jgi:hypothetical protein
LPTSQHLAYNESACAPASTGTQFNPPKIIRAAFGSPFAFFSLAHLSVNYIIATNRVIIYLPDRSVRVVET